MMKASGIGVMENRKQRIALMYLLRSALATVVMIPIQNETTPIISKKTAQAIGRILSPCAM